MKRDVVAHQVDGHAARVRLQCLKRQECFLPLSMFSFRREPVVRRRMVVFAFPRTGQYFLADSWQAKDAADGRFGRRIDATVSARSSRATGSEHGGNVVPGA